MRLFSNVFLGMILGVVTLGLAGGCEEAKDVYTDFEIVLPRDEDPLEGVSRLRYTVFDPSEPDEGSARELTGSDLAEFSFLSGRLDMLPEMSLKIEGFDDAGERLAWGLSLASDPDLSLSANRAMYFASSSSITTAPLELTYGRVGSRIGLPNRYDVLIVGGRKRADELADTVAEVEIFSPLTWTVGVLTTWDGEAVTIGKGMVDHAVSAISSHAVVVAGGRESVSGTENILDTVTILDSYDTAVVREVEADGNYAGRLSPCLAQTGDGEAWLVGGYADTEHTQALEEVWRIDAETSRMEKVLDLPEGFETLACAPVFLEAWRGVVAFGVEADGETAKVLFIDVQTFATTTHAVDWPNRSGVMAQAMGEGKVLFAGGAETTSGLLYNHACLGTSCEVVATVEDLLSSVRSEPSITLAGDADLLVCGGNPVSEGLEAARSCDRLEFGTNGALTRVGSFEMAYPRAHMITAGLANGNVALMGGALPEVPENVDSDTNYPNEIDTELRTMIEVFNP